MHEIPVSYLTECFDYCPDTGQLKWKQVRPLAHFKSFEAWASFRNRFGGQIAGHASDRGYIFVGVSHEGKRHRLLAHRLIWAMQRGHWPADLIDHRNGDPSDNRICNLREASHAENMRNCGARRHNRSGLKNVAHDPATGKWAVSLRVDGVKKRIGQFQDKDLAEFVAQEARKSFHGDFAAN